ncbi:alpha/beta hydrolase [Neorhizobium petrolearium]|uniref:alpha/beta hydrolase n=1 Tax=Neorhizobium petrolearium TaxID=515361 RepID=UPI003F81702B
MHKALFLGILLTLSSCGHPLGVMQPVTLAANAQKTSQVEMLVATNRQPSGDPETLFSGERSPKPYLTEVAVSIPQERKQGAVQWPRQLPPNPASEFAVMKVKQVETLSEATAWFRLHMAGGHALVFVHGYNNRYQDSVFRLAQIVHDSRMQATPILFTWPSRAQLMAYEYDKESANYSRTALEQSLQVLASNPDVKDITILAHSMGTWLTMEALRQMGIRNGRVNPKIANVILASPDIDIQVFAKQFVEMGPHTAKFTIFVSQDDKALAVSSLLTGKVQRLGAVNPAEEVYRSKFEKAGITVVDLTKLDTSDRLNHGKFAESPQIVQLIGERLMKGQTLTDSNVTLGDGVAAVIGGTARTIGAVAATTISAPLNAVEKRQQASPLPDIAQTLTEAPDSKPLID